MPAVLIPLLVLLLFLAAVLLFRMALFGKTIPRDGVMPETLVDKRLIAEHLGQVIQLQTISQPGLETADRSAYQRVQAFLGLHRALQALYPRLHRTLRCEVVQEFSLLYTWPGTDPDAQPILLMAHLDVVPIEPGSETAWDRPPFSGTIAEGYVWGRGAIDYKCGVVGMLESVEWLIRSGFKPRRTIYLAFGHDEELGGMCGARRVASLLKSRGVVLESVLDEGGAVMDGVLPGVDCPVALVGIAEKGYLSLELSVESLGGHSAIPESETAIGLLSRAITRIGTHPMPARLKQVMPLFEHLAGELPFQLRLVLANTWLLGGVAERTMAKSPKMNALMRTTAVPTIIFGGMKDNVLPRKAQAVVNCRLMPGDTIYDVVQHIRKIVDDPRVKVIPQPVDGGSPQPAGDLDQPLPLAFNGWNPPAVTPASSPAFTRLVQTVGQIYPDAVAVPFLMLGASDSRHYSDLSANIFRFLPVHMGASDLERMHGVNERLSIDNCGDMVRFYIQWIRNSDSI